MLSLFVTLIMVTGGIDIQVSSLVGLTSITIGVAWQDFSLRSGVPWASPSCS